MGKRQGVEYLVLRQFELEGATVAYPFLVKINDEVVEEIDGMIWSDQLICLVECKDNGGKKINIEPFAKMRNQLARRPAATIGTIFVTGEITNAALTLANFLAPQTILSWQREEIELCLVRGTFRQSLITKYNYCARTGMADLNLGNII